MVNETKRVAANFRRFRIAKGWTLMQAGEAGKCSWGYIGQIERGVKGLGKRARAKWAKIFGVDISDFLKEVSYENELSRELSMLKEELGKYDIETIKRIRDAIPKLYPLEGTHEGRIMSDDTRPSKKRKGT